MQWLKRLFGEKRVIDEALQDNELARVKQELKIFYKNYGEAIKFLKKNYQKNYKLPLYLIIGQANFGKTSLLAKSGLNLRDVYGQNIQTVLSTKYFTWLFSEKAVFLDVAGVYAKTNKANPHHNLVWIKFLRQLKQYFLSHPIAGVIVTVDIPTLAGPSEGLHKVLDDVCERVYEIAQYANNLPISVVFTKADLLAGFTDFFSDLSLPERKQIFGITFPKVDGVIDPAATFESDYASLLRGLDERSIARLHKEESQEKRALINNFPAQVASLRDAIAEVISTIPHGAGIELRGVYFTSSLQHGAAVDYVAESVFKSLDLYNFKATLPLITNDDTYFIEDLFTEILSFSEMSSGASKEISWVQFVFITVVALILGGSTLSWYHGYKKTLGVMNYVHETLQNKKQLDVFKKLEMAILQTDYAATSWWAHLGFSQVSNINLKLKKVYYQKIAPAFTAELQKDLETELASIQASDYKSLYSALKVYLMLSDSRKMDVNYIKNWFEKYLEKTMPDNLEKRQQFAFNLSIVLEQGIKISPSEEIVAKVREMLNSQNIPEKDLVYATLEGKFAGQNLEFKFGNRKIAISKMYTADNFKKIYEQQIPEIIYGLGNKNRDWVLEEQGKVKFSGAEANKIIDDVRQIYIKSYVDVWNKSLQGITVAHADDVKQASKLIDDLNDGVFPLFALLKAIKTNLSIEKAPAQFTQLVSTSFEGLQDIDIKSIDSAITGLTKYFSTINHSSDVDKAAFLASAARFRETDATHDPITIMRQLALKQPKPVQDWLQDIADNCWHGLLNSTHNYINTVWTTTVASQYQKTLNNKYPLFKDAQSSISLNDFTRFFAAGGAMDSFFNNYLKPFVDTDQLYWVWRDLDGQHLDVTQDKLELFIRSALVRKMFYPNGGTVPNVKFTLIAQALAPTSKSFTLNLGGQIVSYESDQIKANTLVWPGNGTGKLTIAFVNSKGKEFSADMSGDVWTLFKFLAKSNIRAVNGTQHFEFTVDLNANAIKYELVAEQPINPFIPGIIDNFRCPDKL